MDPIRPDQSRNLDRRKRNVSRRGSEAVGGFAERLAAEEVEIDETILQTSTVRSGAALSGSVEDLLDRVHAVGERLLSDHGYTTAQEYREAVRRFLGAVVPDAGSVEINESQRDILSRKRYYLLGRINQSVERLVTGLLRSQMEQMEILSKLEEIEGMLVDLLH